MEGFWHEVFLGFLGMEVFWDGGFCDGVFLGTEAFGDGIFWERRLFWHRSSFRIDFLFFFGNRHVFDMDFFWDGVFFGTEIFLALRFWGFFFWISGLNSHLPFLSQAGPTWCVPCTSPRCSLPTCSPWSPSCSSTSPTTASTR